MGIMCEVEHTDQSANNKTMILKEAHRLYTNCTGKKFV